MPENSQPGDYVPKSLDQVFKDVSTVWTPRLRPRLQGKAITASSAKPDVDNLAEQLAAIKVTDRGSKGSSGKPRTIKIGQVILAEGDVQEFQVNIDVAKAMLETKTMFNLKDLDDARDSLDKLSNRNKALSNFINENSMSKFEKYQVVSFSALTEEHLLDMGVTSRTLSRNHFERILQVFNTFSLTSQQTSRSEKPADIFERFWNGLTKDGRYIRDFKILKNNIGKKPEARARMLTDYILTQLMVFVHELKLVQLMFVELLLSSSSKPVPIRHKNIATLLTGSVDYAILSSVDARAALTKSLGLGPDDMERSIMDMGSENSLDTIMNSKIWSRLQNPRHFKFTIIEEKRKNLDAKSLKDCEPQVTGEALALQAKTDQDFVPWCLSNGEDWVFGTLKNTKESRSLPPMSIRDSDLEGSIKSILKMLILWTVCPVENLKKLLLLE